MQGDAQQPAAMTELIARIDRAIQRVVDGNATMRIPADLTDPDLVLADCKRALLAAQAQPQVPDGWQIVPKEPTEEMWTAGRDPVMYRDVRYQVPDEMKAPPWRINPATGKVELDESKGTAAVHVWRAMIAAAPPVPAQAAPSMEAKGDEAAVLLERAMRQPTVAELCEWTRPTTAAPAEVPSQEHYEQMRLTLIGQVHELMDVAERHAWTKDEAEKRRTLGAIDHARKVTAPYTYNGTAARASSPSGASQEALTAATPRKETRNAD